MSNLDLKSSRVGKKRLFCSLWQLGLLKCCRARSILSRGRAEFKVDWKLALEGILVDYRAGRIAQAIQQVCCLNTSHLREY